MIQSMTGFGAAEHVEGNESYALEIRALNHRFLKINIKVPEKWQAHEAAIEKTLRNRIARGSIACALRIRSTNGVEAMPINLSVLQRYVDQISAVRVPDGVAATIDLGALAVLPGVANAGEVQEAPTEQEATIAKQLVTQAVDALNVMRREEGDALRASLLQCCESVRTQLAEVSARAPSVVQEYHERLKTRVAQLLQAGGLELQEEGLMREVAIFADRCDVAEEVTRLGSHLDQFEELCDRAEPVGRTLDFLTQEMLREANTIGSKSNDAGITRAVVEMKGSIDRLKEQVQNVE